jgi:hypothetical protein
MTAKTSVYSIHISLREVKQTHLQRIHAPDPVECDAARGGGLDMEPSSPNVCTERGPSRNRQLGFKYNLPAISYWGSRHQFRKVHQQEDDVWGTTHSEQSPNGSAKKGRSLDSSLQVNLQKPVVQRQFGHFQSSSFPVPAYGYA